MTNKTQDGEVLQYSNSGSALSAGDVIVIGARVGVAIVDIANGSSGSVEMEGVFSLPKKSADTFSQGALVYWDASPGECTSTDTSNTLAGYAFKAASGGATSMYVKINA